MSVKNIINKVGSALREAGRIAMDRVFPNKKDSIDLFLPAAPPKPRFYPEGFTTDGCSGMMSRFWRKTLKRIPPWEWCCVEHDFHYWRGGFFMDRPHADRALFVCVKESGHPIWAFLMYAAVRIGGSPLWPLPWRWGYGWRYVARYERRDENDRGDPQQELP